MATKLENLRVTKVDFVDEGANPRAHIKLFKRHEPEDPGEGNMGQAEEKLVDSVMKKLADALSGLFGRNGTDVQKAGEASTFREKLDEAKREKIYSEIWDVCYALQNSLGTILSDEEVDEGKGLELMQQSLSEFTAAMNGYVALWSAGETAGIRKRADVPEETELPMLETAYGNLGELIKKAKEQKGEPEEMMKVDKSKMSPEDRAAYEAIIAKYASEEETVEKAGTEPESGEEEEGVEKKKGCPKAKTTELEGGADDIYKGLHPAVRAEIESLKKYREAAEEKELHTVAKKYEIIGKKADELVPTLKSLRAAGGTAYDDMIGILDSMVAAVEQSGVFSEIGKSREGGSDSTSAIEKARAQAMELRKSRPELTEAAALDEVLLSNPEFRSEWDK